MKSKSVNIKEIAPLSPVLPYYLFFTLLEQSHRTGCHNMYSTIDYLSSLSLLHIISLHSRYYTHVTLVFFASLSPSPLFIHMESVCLSVHPSIHPSTLLFVYLSVCLSICSSTHSSVCQSVSLSVYLSGRRVTLLRSLN